jgi:Gas vesicle synthesis protein GvpO
MAESTSNEGKDDGRLSARDLTIAARETIQDLTGYPPEAVSGLQWDGESWLVTVDVLELERIPSTTDLLATYVVQLDDGGGLLGYKRTKRFVRGQAEEG